MFIGGWETCFQKHVDFHREIVAKQKHDLTPRSSTLYATHMRNTTPMI